MTTDSQSPLWRLVSKKAKAIVPLGGQGEGAPLYCVHSIGGEVFSFHLLAQKLGSERKVYGIQVPKDRMGGDFAKSIHSMAAYYADILTAFQPEGPILLGGWSAGSIIALEMAQILRRRGRDVPLLVVLDGILYNTGAEISVWNPLYYWKLAGNLPRWIADNIAQGWGFRGVANRIKRELKLTMASLFSGRKAERGATVDAFMDTTVLPPEQAAFARGLFAALEDYVPQPYDGRVLIYAAKTQPLFHLLQVDVAWGKITTRIDTKYLEGTHLSMLREPQVSILASHLQDYLSKLHTVPERPVENAPLPDGLTIGLPPAPV
jgi:thioesterase domain-containing protein